MLRHRMLMCVCGVMLCAGLASSRASAEQATNSKATIDAVREASEFLADSKVTEAFMTLARADKETWDKSKRHGSGWLKARRDPKAYFSSQGITVPEGITLELASTAAVNQGMYCITACTNLRGHPCANCSHPEKTGCFMVRQCYPLISL